MKDYEFRYINGHVEVFDLFGGFVFSADTLKEALDDLKE